jgi:phosphoglucosamine mutase
MVAGQCALADLLADLRLCPQVLRSVRVPTDLDWRNFAPLQDAAIAAEGALGSRGRLLVRASGTEPLLRLMVEADDAALACELVDALAATLPRA